MKKILPILIIILALFWSVILSSPIWIKYLFLFILERNFGGKIQVEEVSYVFPNEIYAGKINIGSKVALANVRVSVGNIFKLSPINLDLTKPKIVIIHNEKGEWTFPSIPGLEGATGSSTSNINIEIRAKINEGIVIIRDLKTKKEITISKVNGNLIFKDQKITYTVTSSLVEESYKSIGVYNFSDNSGNLSFEFKNANANDWASFFLPDFLIINSGKFNGNISVFSESNNWYVKGSVDANKVKVGVKDFNLSVDNFDTKVSIDKEVIKLDKGQGEWNGAILNLVGKILPELSLEIDIKNLDLSKIDSLYLSNNLSLNGKGNGNFKVLGKLENPNILGKFSVKEGRIYNFSFSNFELISNSLFPKLNINISTNLESGKIEGILDYDIDKTKGSISLKGEDINIENLIKPLNLPPAEGKTSLKIEGKGEKIWKFNIEGEIFDGKLGEYSAEKIKFNVEGEWDLSNFFSQTK
ncbi:MAG: hypothetical protein N2312_06820 [Dictyoglomaceae bacterium]|nr:hypothetical protein [Dictyoglomaceae bacterium]